MDNYIHNKGILSFKPITQLTIYNNNLIIISNPLLNQRIEVSHREV